LTIILLRCILDSMKPINDHIRKPNNFMISPFMQRHLLEISEIYGGNEKNQIRASHGLQILTLQSLQKKGINTHLLYPMIRH